jgi:phosphatidylglycerol:prolipoprotein diacylglycerol transferase
MPAVVPGSYTVLVTLGIVIGLMVQARLLAREHVHVGRVLMVSLVAVAMGLVGAKLWYLALDRQSWRKSQTEGWCIQGFLVGAALTATAATVALNLPVGRVLDATAPGLFIGLAVGKLGCFFTGCCAGRPTGSRWGVWSSDRRIGARRLPAQLLESATSLIIGVAAMLLVLHSRPAVAGALFIASFATYTLCRQFLLRLRAEDRRSHIGGPITVAGSALILAAAMVVMR